MHRLVSTTTERSGGIRQLSTPLFPFVSLVNTPAIQVVLRTLQSTCNLHLDWANFPGTSCQNLRCCFIFHTEQRKYRYNNASFGSVCSMAVRASRCQAGQAEARWSCCGPGSIGASSVQHGVKCHVRRTSWLLRFRFRFRCPFRASLEHAAKTCVFVTIFPLLSMKNETT